VDRPPSCIEAFMRLRVQEGGYINNAVSNKPAIPKGAKLYFFTAAPSIGCQ
jgi:hypothetical protein